jgi:CRP-like cAMP-binding protein
MDSTTKFLLPLVTKLAGHMPDHLPLTREAIALLRRLHSAAHTVRRGDHIITQGRSYGGVWLLADGFGLRYKVLADGKRQVFHVALPGDMLGYPACFFERALFSVVALTEARVCPLTFNQLNEIFKSHSRLALALFWGSACETALYAEQLTTIGRRGAYQRVAAFVLQIASRLHARGLSDGTSFHMPLTQEQIADVLGLTAQHVNRMLRRMREEKLIVIENSQFRLLDREALAALTDFDESYLPVDGEHQSDSALAGAGVLPWLKATSVRTQTLHRR